MGKLYRYISKLLGLTAGVTLLTGLVFASAEATPADVKCKPGDSIAAAIAALPLGPATLTISGICTEEFEITRDDLTLQGVNHEPTIEGTIYIGGAQRTIIQNLTVTGPGYGIDVYGGATVTILDSSISENLGDAGLSVTNNSFVRLKNTDIMNNCEDNIPANGSGTGIDIGMEGVVRGTDNNIIDNCGPGIDAFRRGSYRSEGDTITKLGTAPWAIYLDRDSFMELRDGEVTGDITVNRMSQLHIRANKGIPSTLVGSIQASVQSQVIVEGNSTVSEDIYVELHSYASGAACDLLSDATSICLP